jgi:hypothetical protein
MTEFSKLAIASGFRCAECDQFKEIYLRNKYLISLGVVKKNDKFETTLLKDFKKHIEKTHPDRAKAFLT